MSEIDFDDTTQATDYGHRLRALVDLADTPDALALAINEQDDDANALLLCAVLLLSDALKGEL